MVLTISLQILMFFERILKKFSVILGLGSFFPFYNGNFSLLSANASKSEWFSHLFSIPLADHESFTFKIW